MLIPFLRYVTHNRLAMAYAGLYDKEDSLSYLCDVDDGMVIMSWP
jgi:hypothetical protein